MYDIMRQAEEKLIEVGISHATSLVLFILSIFIIFCITFIGLILYNKGKPQERRMSSLRIFITSLIVGWAITTLVFVYRMVVVGISKLSG